MIVVVDPSEYVVFVKETQEEEVENNPILIPGKYKWNQGGMHHIDAFEKEYQAGTQSSHKPGKQGRYQCLINWTQLGKKIDQHNYLSTFLKRFIVLSKTFNWKFSIQVWNISFGGLIILGVLFPIRFG